MILKRKILLLFVLAALSGPAFAQIAPPPKPPSKEQLKAEKEAQEKAEKAAKEKADAEAKAKAKQEADILKMLEKQAKGESSSAKLSEMSAATVHAKAEAFYTSAMSQINAKHVVWVKQNAKKIFVEKMDDLAFKVMARYYGKNEGLSENAIEGLQVLLLREAFMLESKAYSVYNKQALTINDKKTSLIIAREMLIDSSYQINDAQLDSINLLIKSNSIEITEATKEGGQTAPVQSRKISEKKVDNNSASNFSLTKVKLEESINALSEAKSQQENQMLEIKQHQQKITLMLSKMVNQVTEHQEKIIQNLK